MVGTPPQGAVAEEARAMVRQAEQAETGMVQEQTPCWELGPSMLEYDASTTLPLPLEGDTH